MLSENERRQQSVVNMQLSNITSMELVHFYCKVFLQYSCSPSSLLVCLSVNRYHGETDHDEA